MKTLLQDLINSMKEKNKITEQQAENINIKKVYNFTLSEIWKRIKKAKELQQEKAFYINIPIKEVYKDLEVSNSVGDILVQGIIDLYFVDENDKLVLLDYKTDYVEAEAILIEKYKEQLNIYKQALQEALHRKVDETYIYSTWLDKAIRIN